MKSDEIRENYLSFFESKGHKRHPSSSLVPDDPTLLTTSAGMVQFKPYFLGQKKPPHTRLTTSQKCLRAVDIEEVGRTPRHHTFFEMLGNFSFGDYFKPEIIVWAWEFLTQWLKISPDRLKISVYKDDDDAANLWLKEVGIAPDRLFRFGEDDNFWPAGAPSKGPNGPCGPCSEIFYDFGLERGCGKPDCSPACDCNRHIEIWNLVFMQFERRDGGELVPLPARNIDTGSGLERVASVLQGTKTNFETDLFMPIIRGVEQMTGGKYENTPVPFRVIADHVRGATFLISDGVFPSNEGRGYLLRKILRRAAINSRELGIEQPLLYNVVDLIVESLGGVYPEIKEKALFVRNIVKKEEEQFTEALEQGRVYLVNTLKDRTAGGEAPGDEAFTAYDTYGLPIEEAEKIVRELGFTGIDQAGFEEAMKQQRERSRKGSKMDGEVFVEDKEKAYRDASAGAGVFDGYESMSGEAKIAALIVNGKKAASASAGATVDIIADKTPFYGEMGGQVGDIGSVATASGASGAVTDTFIVDGHIVVHRVELKAGSLKEGETVKLEVDRERRLDIMRHHTATHLLHAALRRTLGEHVVQSGSYVGPDKLRFDFTHPAQVDKEALRKIEDLVNRQVFECTPVGCMVTDIATAKSKGAMALFGEKYGEEVRMVSIGDFSKELCGGTHISNTGCIGLVKITEERAIGSSLRRIEAVAGMRAVELVHARNDALAQASSALRVTPEMLPKSIENMLAENDELRKEMKKLAQERAKEQAAGFLDDVEEVNGVSVFVKTLDGVDKNGALSIFDDIKAKVKSYAVMLAAVEGDKAMLLCAFSDDLVSKGCDAGAVVKQAAQAAGGGGGGKKNMAQAGAKDVTKVPDAMALARKLILEKLNG